MHDSFCTVSADTLAYVWDLETAELCGVCRGHTAGILTYPHACSRMLTYAHLCSRMATYGAGVSAVVWIEEHAAWVTACDDSTLRMWNADGTPRIRRARAEEKKEGHAGESRGDSRQHAGERERERERTSGSAGIDGSSHFFSVWY
jgi:hypothetical protein